MTARRPGTHRLTTALAAVALAAVATAGGGCTSQPARHHPTNSPTSSPTSPTPDPGADPEAANLPADCLDPNNQQPQLDACQARLLADLPPGLLDAHGQPPAPYDLNVAGRLLCERARDDIVEGRAAITVAANAEDTINHDPNAPVGPNWTVRYLGVVFTDLCADVGAYLSAAYTNSTK